MIRLLYQANVSLTMKEGDGPHWFSIIADEAADIINTE